MADQTKSALPPIPSASDALKTDNRQEVASGPDELGPTSKDMMIGAGALLVLAILFFFIRISFVNYLIGPSMKRSPNNAGMAGWGLFGGLFFGSALGCAALVSKTYLTMPLIIALSVLSLICFVIAIVVAAKK
jgi:hypothetical protein